MRLHTVKTVGDISYAYNRPLMTIKRKIFAAILIPIKKQHGKKLNQNVKWILIALGNRRQQIFEGPDA